MGIGKALGMLTLTAAIGLGAIQYAIANYPPAQTLKRRYLPALSAQSRYDIPTTQTSAHVEPIRKPRIKNLRETTEDRVAELLITRADNIGKFYPGGILLTKNETRTGHLFGRYCSYDPEKTQNSVDDALNRAQSANKRIIIWDEGEGGFVPRIGTLPAAEDIGFYYRENKIGPTIRGRVTQSVSRNMRTREIRRLFDEYARELHDRGVDAVFGPVLDVVEKPNGKNLIARDGRAFGSTYDDTIELASMYVDAMHRYGIETTGKHFLGAGIPVGDVHAEEVVQTSRISPRLRAANVYRRLSAELDAVMVTHIENPLDRKRPYSISSRAIDFLTQPRYNSGRYRGIDFNGLVVVDDVSMKGLTIPVEEREFAARQERLVKGCGTEGKAAVLSLDAGVHAVISVDANTDSVTACIAGAYRRDAGFRQTVDRALMKYNEFARNN